jgi:hypothetical protein
MLASLSHSLDERRKKIDVTKAVAVHLDVESRRTTITPARRGSHAPHTRAVSIR